jgi:PAS domain S-box-containing protein
MKSLWELLWDYDPNGLLVLDSQMNIKVVNQAFCRMFHTEEEQLIGLNAAELLEDISDLVQVWESGEELVGTEREYPKHGLYLRRVIFPVPEENVVACIMVDLTAEWKQRNEILTLKRETLLKVHAVVDRQMSVAQEIAGLLGETTAETKASLLKLLEMVEKEHL